MNSDKQKTILLVEDEAIISITGKKSLEQYGYNVITANSGEKAVDMVCNKNESVDLILMDIDLGTGIDGTDAAEAILNVKDIPVVFLSSHIEPEVVEKTEKITSFGYVVKASNATVLDASIKMAFKLFDARMKLQKSEERLQSIFDNVPIGMFQSTKEGKFINVNRTLPAILRYDSQNELMEKVNSTSIAEALYVDPSLRPKLVNQVEHSSAGWKVFDNRYYCKDGSIIDALLTFSEQEDILTGQIILNGFVQDITERKHMEDELFETKNYLENLLNYANAPIIVWDTDYKITRFNRAFERISGRLSEDVIGKHVDMLFPAETREQSIEHIQDATVGNRWDVIEIEIAHVDGTVYTLLWNSAAVYMPDGKTIKSIIAQGHDITIRKHIANELKKSEEKYKSLFENVSDAIFFYNPDTLIITEVNDATSRLYGYDREELIGMSCLKFSAELEESKKAADRIISEGGIDVNFRHHKKKDGTDLYLHLTGHKITVNGKVMTFSVCRDQTERKLYEEKIRKLLREKELILKEVHHRIKNNMNSVKGLLSLQMAFLEDQKAISALQDTISRVDSMVVLYDKLYSSDNFKDISVLEYLPSLIDEIISNFPGSESVKVVKEIDDFIIELRVLQPLGIIINEILTNMMKHAFKGRINNIISVSAAKKDKKVSIVISDNGKGMPEDISFENSTGFGMQLISMLTEQIEGTIKVEHVDGTKFVIEFEVN